MGDRSQHYFKYNGNKLFAQMDKYTDGPDLVKQMLVDIEMAIDALRQGEEIPCAGGENMFDRFFWMVETGQKKLSDYSSIWNWGNQCGKYFVELLPDGSIIYCFTNSEESFPPGKQEALDWKGYLAWSRTTYESDPRWEEDSHYDFDVIQKEISAYRVMTTEELRGFLEFPYDMEGMYADYLMRTKNSK